MRSPSERGCRWRRIHAWWVGTLDNTTNSRHCESTSNNDVYWTYSRRRSHSSVPAPSELTVLQISQRPDDADAGTVEDWATESLLAAREAYVDPATGKRIKSGDKLGLNYHNKNLPVVKERMYRAGVRLAKVLNECIE
jgi:S1/P1 Nuclease